MTDSIKSMALTAGSTANANTYVDPNGLASIKKDPNSPQAARAVAQQVDALFIQMMLKSMRDASAASGASDSNEMSMYQDMFDKQIALNLSQHQGLGLGSLLTRQIGGAAGSPAPGAAAAGARPATGTAPAGAASTGTPSRSGLVPAASVPGATVTAVAADGSGGGASAAAEGPPLSMQQIATDFVGHVLPTIRAAAQALGVNPLALLAQAALETGWGKRMAHTADGRPSLNLFGIKADDHWDGARAVAGTVEYSGGIATVRHTAFRAYASIEDSVSDFTKLMKTSPRYRQALEAGRDVHRYASGMGSSGYATDPDYGNKLSVILNSGVLREALSSSAAKL